MSSKQSTSCTEDKGRTAGFDGWPALWVAWIDFWILINRVFILLQTERMETLRINKHDTRDTYTSSASIRSRPVRSSMLLRTLTFIRKCLYSNIFIAKKETCKFTHYQEVESALYHAATADCRSQWREQTLMSLDLRILPGQEHWPHQYSETQKYWG